MEGSLLQLLLKLRRDIDKDLLDVFAFELEGLFQFETRTHLALLSVRVLLGSVKLLVIVVVVEEEGLIRYGLV